MSNPLINTHSANISYTSEASSNTLQNSEDSDTEISFQNSEDTDTEITWRLSPESHKIRVSHSSLTVWHLVRASNPKEQKDRGLCGS